MTTGSILDSLLKRLSTEEWGILQRTDFVMDVKYNLSQQFGDMRMVSSPVLIADGSYIEDWTTSGEIAGGVTVDLVTGTIPVTEIGQYLVGIKLAMDVEMNHDYVLTVEFGNGENMIIEEGMGIQMDIITMTGVVPTKDPTAIRVKMESDNGLRTFAVRTGQMWVARIG